jgi:hypothetical protein
LLFFKLIFFSPSGVSTIFNLTYSQSNPAKPNFWQLTGVGANRAVALDLDVNKYALILFCFNDNQIGLQVWSRTKELNKPTLNRVRRLIAKETNFQFNQLETVIQDC